MAVSMVKTKAPGIFRRGSRYVVPYRDPGGRQRKPSFRTFEEARRFKRGREADVDRGEYIEASRQTLHDYAREWIDRYQGGRRGFREQTRDGYRQLLDAYALRHFDERLKLTELTPRHVARFIAWLVDEHEQGRRLSDKTIRNVLGPLRACLATARREGLIRHNPCDGAQLPHRPQVEDDDEQEDVRALGRDQLAVLLLIAHPRYRLLFRLLAATGLRISEAIALQWRHVQLDGAQPHVKIRRRIVRGAVGPVKSAGSRANRSRRDVPLSPALVSALRAWHKQTEWPGPDDLLFPTMKGTPLSPDNVRKRYLKPAVEEAGAPWAGFHSLRHTNASLLIADGRNIVQVSRWLGHHSPAFTLGVYAHLLEDGVGEPLELELTPPGGNTVASSAAFGVAGEPGPLTPKAAWGQGNVDQAEPHRAVEEGS